MLYTHNTTILLLVWNMSGSTRVSRYQKGKTKKVKTNLDLLEKEIVSGSGICWAICKSAPHADNHANIPPLSFFFTGRMPFLTPNQQRQSTEGTGTAVKYLEIQKCLISSHNKRQQTSFKQRKRREWYTVKLCYNGLLGTVLNYIQVRLRRITFT